MDGNMQQPKIYGTKEIMILVTKIFGIIGIIFIGISLAVPWAGYTSPGTNFGLSLNAWGVSHNIPAEYVVGEASSYLSDPFFINTMQAGIAEGIVASICMIMVFIFAIITLLVSIKAFKTIGTGINKNYLTAGIFCIVLIILSVIAASMATSYATTINYLLGGGAVYGGFGYTWGFILTIIAMIFFFLNYGLPKFLLQTNVLTQTSPTYQQQPQVMYTSQQQPPMQQTPPIEQPKQQTPPPQQQPVQQTPPPQQIPPPQQPQQPQTEAGICPKCGAQLQANAKFCSSCRTQF